MKRLLAVAALVAGFSVFPAVAHADTPVDCQVQGVLLIIALNGPVTVCTLQITSPDSTTNSLQVPVTVSPHLFTPEQP